MVQKIAVVGIVLGLAFFGGCGGGEKIEAKRRFLGKFVQVGVPSDPLFVQSYVDAEVLIDLASGLSFEDLTYELDPQEGGFVSRSPDASLSSMPPKVRLVAGQKVGTFRIDVIEPSGGIVGQATFQVTDEWEDDNGPSLVVVDVSPQTFAWPPVEKEDDPSKPCKPTFGARGDETMKVSVLFVDTASGRFTTSQVANLANDWENLMTGGAAGMASPSVKGYFQEVSGGRFTIEAEVVKDALGVPVVASLPKGWNTYFKLERHGQLDSEAKYYFFKNTNIPETLIRDTASLYSYHNTDAVIFVVKDDLDLESYLIPAYYFRSSFVSIGPFNPLGGGGFQKRFYMISFTVMQDSLMRPNVVSHELGHALGLPDLYPTETNGVNGDLRVDFWDIMDESMNYLPHFSISNKARLGWIDPDKVKCIRYQAGAPHVDIVKIDASYLATDRPPPPNYAALEIQIASGQSLFVEHRVRTPANRWYIGDQHLVGGSRPSPSVVITQTYPSVAAGIPGAEPMGQLITMAAPKGNPSFEDGPVLQHREAFQVENPLGPAHPAEIRVSVDNLNDTSATLYVAQNVVRRPELSIRDWDESFHSPDILVRNERNYDFDAERWIRPEWRYAAFANNPNWVVASVKNEGEMDAPRVRVKFEWTRSGAGGEWHPLGSVKSVDIPQGKIVDVVSDEWIPDPGVVAPDRHYCVRVTILGDQDGYYVVPGLLVRELSNENNKARSNFQRFISETSSPSSRVGQRFLVVNPRNYEQTLRLEVTQTNPLFRTYLENRWLKLGPNEEKEVLVQSEYAGEEERDLTVVARYKDEPNRVIFEAFEGPGYDGDTVRSLGGNQLEVGQGLAVRFSGITLIPVGGEFSFEGRVVVKKSGAPPDPGGAIILTLADATGKLVNRTIEPSPNGAFSTLLPSGGWTSVRAYYVPPPGFGDVTSEKILNPLLQ